MSGEKSSSPDQLQRFMQAGFDLAIRMENVAADYVSRGTDAVYGRDRSTSAPAEPSSSADKPRGGPSATRQTGDAADIANLASDLVGALLRFTTNVVSQVAGEAVKSAGDARDAVTQHPVMGGLVDTVSEPIRSAVGLIAPQVDAQGALLLLPDASPGQTSAVHVVVRNDSERTFDVVRLRSSAFVGVDGSSIPGQLVTFTPAAVTVMPGEKLTVACTVAVPHDAVRGLYCAVIDAVDIVGVRLLAQLDVV